VDSREISDHREVKNFQPRNGTGSVREATGSYIPSKIANLPSGSSRLAIAEKCIGYDVASSLYIPFEFVDAERRR